MKASSSSCFLRRHHDRTFIAYLSLSLLLFLDLWGGGKTRAKRERWAISYREKIQKNEHLFPSSLFSFRFCFLFTETNLYNRSKNVALLIL